MSSEFLIRVYRLCTLLKFGPLKSMKESVSRDSGFSNQGANGKSLPGKLYLQKLQEDSLPKTDRLFLLRNIWRR